MSDPAPERHPWSRQFLIAGGVLGALAVAAGAFGAHALTGRLEPRMVEVWATASRYHMWHAIALLAFAAAPVGPRRAALAAGACWVLGTLLFSGSLYLLALTGIGVLGAITPVGGLALIAGWVLAAAAAAGGVRATRGRG